MLGVIESKHRYRKQIEEQTEEDAVWRKNQCDEGTKVTVSGTAHAQWHTDLTTQFVEEYHLEYDCFFCEYPGTRTID